MKNKKWKEFGKLTGKCYLDMANAVDDASCWQKAYETLKEIIADERSNQPGYEGELYQLDEETDYNYDVQGWLEDYLDELEMNEEHEKLLKVCDELLGMFQWKEDSPSDIKFMKSSTLRAMGRTNDAAVFCRQWLEDAPDDICAVTANIYADIDIQDLEAAESLIKQYIGEEVQCTEENDILFTAASQYYEKSGNKKEKKRIDRELNAYEKELKKFFMGEEDDDEVMWGEEDLPFN